MSDKSFDKVRKRLQALGLGHWQATGAESLASMRLPVVEKGFVASESPFPGRFHKEQTPTPPVEPQRGDAADGGGQLPDLEALFPGFYPEPISSELGDASEIFLSSWVNRAEGAFMLAVQPPQDVRSRVASGQEVVPGLVDGLPTLLFRLDEAAESPLVLEFGDGTGACILFEVAGGQIDLELLTIAEPLTLPELPALPSLDQVLEGATQARFARVLKRRMESQGEWGTLCAAGALLRLMDVPPAISAQALDARLGLALFAVEDLEESLGFAEAWMELPEEKLAPALAQLLHRREDLEGLVAMASALGLHEGADLLRGRLDVLDRQGAGLFWSMDTFDVLGPEPCFLRLYRRLPEHVKAEPGAIPWWIEPILWGGDD